LLREDGVVMAKQDDPKTNRPRPASLDTHPSSAEEGSSRHETKDFKPSWVAMFAVMLVYVIVVVYMLTFTIFSQFKTEQVAETNAGLFPEPRLQIDPQSELGQVQERDREVLNSYAWVDRDSGVVRIPIERAMELVVDPGAKGGTK
jgi:hypothetical protein